MNKSQKFFVGALLTLLLVVSVATAGCTDQDDDDDGSEEPETITVGTSADFPPFEYTENGTIVGFDVELIKAVAESQGYEVEVEDISFDSLIPSLKNEKVDVVAAAMTITEERKEEIAFTDPYYEADQSILVRKGSDLQIESPDDLVGLEVGAQTGTTGAGWVESNLIENGTMSEDNLNKYDSYEFAVRDLVNENLDAVVLDKPVGQSFEGSEDVEVVYTIETGEEYGFGVRQEDEELLQDLNAGIEEVQGSDTWDQLVSKYFGG